MKNKILLIKLLLLSLLLFSCQNNKLAIQTGPKIAANQMPLTFVDDLDHNAFSEIINVSQGDGRQFNFLIQISELDSKFQIHSEPMWVDTLLDVKAFDLTDNGRKEILYTYQIKDSLYLKIYDPYAKNEKAFLLNEKLISASHISGKKYWQGGFKITDFADLNHDGHTDILLVVWAGYDKYPRGVMAYDFYHQKKLWFYPIGPIVNKAFIKDINNDNVFEIFLRNWAPNNGAAINGTDDAHSYFIVLNEKGKLIHQEERGGEYSQLNVHLVKFRWSGDEKIITISLSRNINDYDKGEITEWKIDDQNRFYRIRENNTFMPITDTGIANMEYEGTFYLFVPNAQNQICLLDSTLKVINRFAVQEQIAGYAGSYDLNGDGHPEQIWRTISGAGLILNNQFKLLKKIPGLLKVFLIKQGRYNPPRFAILKQDGFIEEIKLVNQPFYYFLFHQPMVLFIIILLILNLLFWFSMIQRFKYHSIWNNKSLEYLDTAFSAILILDSKGRITSLNKKMEEILSVNKDEIYRKYYHEVFDTGELAKLLKQLIKKNFYARKNVKKKLMITDAKVNHFYDLYLQMIYSQLNRFEGVIVILNDITPVVRSQKTEAWVTVAQKLAHELKNPLTAVRLSLQRLKMEYEDDLQLKERLSELVDGSLEEISRVQDVVGDFMRFSKIELSNMQLVDVASVITEIVDKYQLILPDKVKLSVKIENGLPQIQADQNQLSTVLTNLMDNAIQSITPPGEIQIKAGYCEKVLAQEAEFLERFVEIEIADTGHGMDDETQSKIFHPFFTTKETGSGLGMNIVKQIIEEHKGEIEIFSKPELGTRVTIRLPLITEQE